MKLVVAVMLVSLMLQSGIEVNREQLRSVLHQYRLLAIAVLVNFVLVPLFAVAVVRLMHLNDDVAVGLLLMAIAPGVPFLARAAGRTAGGSLVLALGLSFVMPALSVITVPVMVRLIMPAQDVTRIPMTPLIVTLVVFQLVPLVAGLAIRERAPETAARLVRPLTVLIAICIAGLLIILAPALAKSVASVFGTMGLFGALLVVLFSATAGYVFGGRDLSERHTLSIATTLRNIGLASVIATADFANTLVPAVVISYFVIQILVGAVLGKTFARPMKRAAALVLLFALAFPAAATAMGKARIQHPDGSVNTYANVRIALSHAQMSLTSADGVGTIVIQRAGCVIVDKLLRCNPIDAELRQRGEITPIVVVESTAWFNPANEKQTLPLSSTQLPPRGVLMTMRSKNGTFLSLSGTADVVASMPAAAQARPSGGFNMAGEGAMRSSTG